MLFPFDAYEPKQAVLVTGGAMLFYLGAALFLQLAVFERGPSAQTNEYAIGWYAILIVLCSAFFGAFRGWVGENPHVQRALEYQNKNWRERQSPPVILDPPGENPVPVTTIVSPGPTQVSVLLSHSKWRYGEAE